MSTVPQGSGWWMASDHHWYPPELHPSVVDVLDRPGPDGGDPPDGTMSYIDVEAESAALPRSPVAAPRRRWRRRVVMAAGAAMLVTAAVLGGLALSGTSTTAGTTQGTAPATAGGSAPGSSPPRAVGGGGAPAGALVTPAVERAVMASTWEGFADAVAEDDVAGMAPYSTLAVRRVVTGSYACACTPWPVAYSAVSFSAPPQSRYPVFFLAEVQGKDYDGAALTREVVFTRANADAPWLISFLGAFSYGSSLLGPGPADVTAAPPAVPTPVTSVPATFAAYLLELDTTGTATPPSDVEQDSVFESAFLTSVRNHLFVAQHGLAERFGVSVAGISPAFSVRGGSAVCAAITTHAVVTSTGGAPIVQYPDQTPWGYLLASGSYSSIVEDGVSDVCFAESAGGEIQPVVDDGGTYSTTATRLGTPVANSAPAAGSAEPAGNAEPADTPTGAR